MMTIQDQRAHDAYEALPARQREIVDSVFTGIVAELKAAGAPCAMDDRAEALVGAIARYVIESEKP